MGVIRFAGKAKLDRDDIEQLRKTLNYNGNVVYYSSNIGVGHIFDFFREYRKHLYIKSDFSEMYADENTLESIIKLFEDKFKNTNGESKI